MIEFEQVTYDYPLRGERPPALSDVALTLADGERLAVLGPNGSGKSTLALLSNGMLRPGKGHVLVDGVDTRDERRMFDVRSTVGLVFQNPENQIVATSVEDDVAFGPENLGLPPKEIRARVTRAIEAVGLEGLEQREPHLLSGGQKQRLAIAGALALEPRHLILDEPTAMLDPTGRADVLAVLERLHARGTTILHVTHRLEEALAADRALVLSVGRVVFDGEPRLLAERAELEEWGIALPGQLRLARLLKDQGVPLLDPLPEPTDVIEALWR
jgi:energy-coupling factor transport system ATP-binding protein